MLPRLGQHGRAAVARGNGRNRIVMRYDGYADVPPRIAAEKAPSTTIQPRKMVLMGRVPKAAARVVGGRLSSVNASPPRREAAIQNRLQFFIVFPTISHVI
jgi:hypothetical protein